jgi:hypothetical protein
MKEVRKVTKKRRYLGGMLATAAMTLAAVLLVAGCSSFDEAVASAIGKSVAPSAQPAQQTQPAPAPTPQKQQAPAPAAPAQVYQYQFNAFYAGMWSMGWFGYKDANYKPGQGTVWTFTSTGGGSSKPVTFERALLKITPNASQWWRFKLDTGEDTLIYEFLVGSDARVQKVRYKDPDTGAIGEFVPSQTDQQTKTGPGASGGPKSRADFAKYKVDKQRVQVKAGTYNADHYKYTDETDNGTGETWVNETVPGYMVKTVYTSKKNNQTSTGELIQIESGVTTILSSY